MGPLRPTAGNTMTAKLMRPVKKLAILICPVLVFFCIIFLFGRNDTQATEQFVRALKKPAGDVAVASDVVLKDSQLVFPPPAGDIKGSEEDDIVDTQSDDDVWEAIDERPDYRELFSLSTKNRKFFRVQFGDHITYNPNIIPHPTKHDTWIVIAQHEGSCEPHNDLQEMVCDAIFWDDMLICTSPPVILPVELSIPGRCQGDLAALNLQYGPRDARVSYGPEAPYILYGSQSMYTCVSIWLQDVRMLLDEFRLEQAALIKSYEHPTEVQRPPPYAGIEKNFFLFWDAEGNAHAHYEIAPKRVFAQMSLDGSIGPDLAPQIASHDDICMAQYMPTVGREMESLHQATNSLSITLCNRADRLCTPSDTNTFIMTIFHYKKYHDYHAIYEPYVMLFQRTAPFAIHAISQRPLWIHGRGPFTNESGSLQWQGSEPPRGHTEMFYMTSITWKSHGQKYHGHMDDELFLAFGIEDARSGAIDVAAGDLLQDLAFCSGGLG